MSSPQANALAEPATAPLVPQRLKRLVLTGFMGAGKSTIGRLLAARIGWDFLDVDTHLEARTGATIPQLFERHGEAHFRRLESSALASALSRAHTVLALGGGAPEELTNRLLIEQTPATFTIFLDAPFPMLYDRCMLQEIGRPVLANPEAAQARFARRHPLYRRISRLTIDTAAITPEQTVEAILTALNAALNHSQPESNSALPRPSAHGAH
ncbi:shikimate kinase [Edaphobacter sp.]|uniref:shikimate kinase n=1 Tax=Edaphobacter sp. TaxID=1934404 RepID=UPI002DC02D56|nr:shikimate kinase [Edaphobacter sp.]HEU5341939.1 shikimate kinase [Edaphobacter sp.]